MEVRHTVTEDGIFFFAGTTEDLDIIEDIIERSPTVEYSYEDILEVCIEKNIKFFFEYFRDHDLYEGTLDFIREGQEAGIRITEEQLDEIFNEIAQE